MRGNRLLTGCVITAVLALAACSDYTGGPVKSRNDAIAAARIGWASVQVKASRREIYSKETRAKFEPYTAELQDGVWTVKGTIPSDYKGTVLVTQVRASDGSVSITCHEVP